MLSNQRVVIVTNAPPPYRIPAWRLLAAVENIDLQLVFFAPPHIDTSKSPADFGFNANFLTGRYLMMAQSFMHVDIGVWPLLTRLKPDVVITTGYIPTFLFAFAWSVFHRIPHIAMTDGTFNSEQRLTWVHRVVRKMVFKLSAAFVGASEGSRRLFNAYGIPDERIHLSYLCTDNQRFNYPSPKKPTDFIFCGRFIALKRPMFAMDVAKQTAIQLGRRVSLDFVGAGEMETEMREYAAKIAEFVDVRFLGYATQAELPERYATAKIFLFPSENDTWGVVANEACAAGVPVIVSPHAGVANELVVDNVNGFVCELKLEPWVTAAVTLLSDDSLYQHFSQNCRKQVNLYTFENSATGLLNAIKQVFNQ